METNAVSAVSGLTSLVSLSSVFDTTVIPRKQYQTGLDLLIFTLSRFIPYSFCNLYRRDQAICASFYSLDVRSLTGTRYIECAIKALLDT